MIIKGNTFPQHLFLQNEINPAEELESKKTNGCFVL
jgi:hypothetical protein